MSGKSVSLQTEADGTVHELIKNARRALRVGKGRLLTSSGEMLDGSATVTQVHLQDGDELTLHVGHVAVASDLSSETCAALLGDGSVTTWGSASFACDIKSLQARLQDVHHIQASQHAFAAIRADGSVVTWGDAESGGDSSAVQDSLHDVQQIQASGSAFAAIRADGSVITWGQADFGGDSSTVQDRLQNVQHIQSSEFAFAAIRADGSVVTWGHGSFGGDCSLAQAELQNVKHVQASQTAFAAILADDSVVAWGDVDEGGDSSAVHDLLHNVQHIQASLRAFAAIRADGSVVTWGHPTCGGNSSAVQDRLQNIEQIQASEFAFAAIRADGSVVAWGHADFGGDSSAVQDRLHNVQRIQASRRAFAAIRADGSVVCWGDARYGGNGSSVQDRLYDIKHVQASSFAFAAIRSDGSVVTWGDARSVGNSNTIQDRLQKVQQIQASQYAFAAIRVDGSVVTWGWGRASDSSHLQILETDWPSWSSTVQHHEQQHLVCRGACSLGVSARMEPRPRSRSLRGPSLAAAFEAARVKVESETESGECTSPSPCSDRRPRAGRLPLRSIVPNPGLTSIKMEVEDAQNESAVLLGDESSGECSPEPDHRKLEFAAPGELHDILPDPGLLPVKMEAEDAKSEPEATPSEESSRECSPEPGPAKLELAEPSSSWPERWHGGSWQPRKRSRSPSRAALQYGNEQVTAQEPSDPWTTLQALQFSKPVVMVVAKDQVHWMWLLAVTLGVVFWPGPCSSLPQRLWLAKDLRKSVTKKKHPWLYDRALRNQPGIAAGELVAVCWKKQMLAYGFHDPTSPLRVRLLWWPEDGPPMPGDPSWAQDIARRAAARLPIIIDAFGEAGYKLSGVINKDGTETLWGTAPSKEASSFEENGVMYEVDVWHGHKTGFFLDQRPNRLRLRELAAGKDVLDLFSYTGGFAVAAALGGARRCFAVDAARKAVEACERNFRLNGLHAQVSSGTEQFQPTQNMIHLADCWEFLRNAAEAKDAFDIVVCDPPSMAPRVSARPQALKAYSSLNQGALKVLRPGGRLISCSCSSHITRKDLLNTVQEAAQLLGRSVVLEEEGSAGADHPTRRGFPEGEYLQAYLPPRTRLCYHFIRGCCRWEHNCRRHHPHERQLAEISRLLRMVPCRWGSQCRMKNCVFKHEEPEWQRAEDPEVQEQQRAESDESSAESIGWASSREGSTSASTTEDESSASDDEDMSRSRQQFLQSKANPVLIFQDAGICVISKPAGWSADHCPVSRGPDGRPLSLKALHSSGSIEPLSRHPASPVGSWRPFLAPGPTVSGLALMTQTEGAPRRRLARAFRTGRLASYSLALVEGKLDPQRSSAAARCESGLLEVLALAGLERRCSETWGSEASCEHFTLLLVKVLFREDVSLPLPTGADLLQRLDCSSLDQLRLGGHSITGEIQPKDGDEEVTLTLVRVLCNLLEGFAEDLIRSLTCTHALELPPGYLKQEHCLSLVKSETVRNSGWYFWEHKISSHVLLLQDGSTFTKQSSSVVNAKRGEQIHCHSIAEGRFEPVLTTPGELLVTWTSAAEIEVKGPWSRLHEKASDFRKATWERRNVLDVLPTALQTETGRLELQQLCYKWPQSQQAHTSLVMPCLSEKVLADLGMKPTNLWFWCPQAEAT
ncbi:Ribosomal RNA large subunit methyltransferase I [Symbiodinium microadriaticum]|uniref:Ribosomal RNA large subunit methyltransferase I n=1 Tax=Symbiodinium microadriaticum TaxID=2951 RepID=A0A1Q9DEU2_SYMMI|nr:Ribosomal RNA large subunit methyltransferase I [Symbiodinium microadriaticum]